MKAGRIFSLAAAVCMLLALAACAEKEAPAPTELSYSPGEYFVTNLKQAQSSGAVHLLRATITLVVSDEDYLKALTEDDSMFQPIIRDAIVFVIRNQTFADIQEGDDDNQLLLRQAILNAVNAAMRGRISGKTININNDYFTGCTISDFVVQ